MEAVEHMELVALNPGELAQAQSHLIDWCRRKIGELVNDRADAEERLRVTANTALHTDAFTRQVNKAKQEIVYYQKLVTALEAGYLIIPNLPMSLFAVRTKRVNPSGEAYHGAWNVPDVRPQALPQGEGRYVSPRPTVSSRKETEWNEQQKKDVEVTLYEAADFREISFPVALVKPSILEATKHALALKLFDEVGIVNNQEPKADPIVVGRIRHPQWRNWNQRQTTFFIAWWLNTRSL